MGRSELNTVQSLVLRALEHRLKAQAWPSSGWVGGWREEARVFLDDASCRWTPSMAQRIVLDAVYRRALKHLRKLSFQQGPGGPVHETCPVTLADLIGGDAEHLAPQIHPPVA